MYVMVNLKGFAIANDGDMKRVAVTFDVVDEVTGKPVEVNVKANNFITDKATLDAVSIVEEYVRNVINAK